MRDLAPKITRHGADEDKHGRIFNALMSKRGLQPVEVPPDDRLHHAAGAAAASASPTTSCAATSR